MTCRTCGGRNHPGLKAGQCPFDDALLSTLDYNKVVSMLGNIEFETNNPHAIRVRMEFLENLPSYGVKRTANGTRFPKPGDVDHMDDQQVFELVYLFGIEGSDLSKLRKALKRKLNMRKTKQTPRGEIRMNFILSCSIEGHTEYDHVFHMKDLPLAELQDRLGTTCGFTHGNGKKCLGKIITRSNT